MPNVSDLGKSKYLKQTDVTPDLTVTIAGYDLVNMAKEGETKEMKYCLNFQGDVKPLSLNKTNGELIELNLGSGDFDNWIGKQIILYADPTIMCKGQRTGGIRVRYYPPQQQASQSQFTPDNNLAGVDDFGNPL
jgi:hypothetical protein